MTSIGDAELRSRIKARLHELCYAENLQMLYVLSFDEEVASLLVDRKIDIGILLDKVPLYERLTDKRRVIAIIRGLVGKA